MTLSSRLMLRFSVACALSTALTACASTDFSDYPTLGRRPIEQRQQVVDADQVTPPPPAVVSATVQDAVRGLLNDANGGESAFRRELETSRGVVAGARAATGSEAWAAGQAALSRIDAARGPSTFALAEADRMALVALDQGDEAGALALSAAQEQIGAMVAEQNRILAGLGIGG